MLGPRVNLNYHKKCHRNRKYNIVMHKGQRNNKTNIQTKIDSFIQR